MKDYNAIYKELAIKLGTTDLNRGRKAYQLIERNKQRSADLYKLPESSKDIDYIECPVLGIRMLSMRSAHVTKILGMTMDEFKEKYPNQLFTCDGHTKSISKGLNEIDETTGLTKHQLSAEKSKVSRKEVGDDGLTSYERSGIKTKNTHLNRIDENGLNGYQRIAIDARPKQIETLGKTSNKTISDEDVYEVAYRNFVDWLGFTNKTKIMEGYKTGRMGVDGAFQCDHRYSVNEGFRNKVSPWVISNIHNMNAVTWEYNAAKQVKSDIELDELFDKTGYCKDESEYEYDRLMMIIKSIIDEDIAVNSGDILIRFNDKSPVKKMKY